MYNDYKHEQKQMGLKADPFIKWAKEYFKSVIDK